MVRFQAAEGVSAVPASSTTIAPTGAARMAGQNLVPRLEQALAETLRHAASSQIVVES
jgi:hypothetical protein